MDLNLPSWSAQTRDAVEECFDQVRFARATDLARSGRYLEAQGLLTHNGLLPETARDLDLLARIAALNRQWAAAGEFWMAALRKDPENQEYQRCLEALDRINPRALKLNRLALLFPSVTLL